jgi:hypothetical protein
MIAVSVISPVTWPSVLVSTRWDASGTHPLFTMMRSPVSERTNGVMICAPGSPVGLGLGLGLGLELGLEGR